MAAAPVLGAVEVQKDAGSKTWYCGHIVDVVRDSVVVTFESVDGSAPAGDVWKRQPFPLSSVRKPPRLSPADLEKFTPRIGDEVELRVDATEHSPASWALAVVKNIKSNSFYFVTRSSSVVGGSGEAIVEKDMLRPPYAGTGLTSGSVKQETFDMKPELHAWMTTSDAAGCFSHIEELAGLLYIQRLDSKLSLIGDAKSTQRARMLLEVHVKHQAEIQRFQDMREKRLRALETKRSRIQGTGYKHSVEVKVDASYIKRIIGKGGEAIKALEQKYGVSVRIVEEDGAADEERLVRIFGNSPESLDKARAEVEFVEEMLSVEPEQYSWILGRKGSNIQAFRDSCNLVYASLNRDSRHLRICGTRQAVQDALAMFETHLMYFPVVRQMDEEMEQILGQLEEYGDWNARWEWGWYRDDEPEESWSSWSDKKSGYDSWSGGHSGWDDWKDWHEDAGKGSGSWRGTAPKGEKGTGRGKAKGKGWQHEEYWEESWEEYEEDRLSFNHKGRGKGKGGKNGGNWSYRPKEEEDMEESYEAPGGKGRYVPRGRGGRAGGSAGGPVGSRSGRELTASADRPPPERRMGKHGPRI